MRKWLKRILIVVILFIIFCLSIIVFSGYVFYKSVFRLSYEQINTYLLENNSENGTGCRKFSECELLPGDILIRRYVTNVSDLFSKTLNPYFTHSAIYLGNDELFEALGDHLEPKDQIQISKLSESDWMDEDMKNFVVIRPKNYNERFGEIKSNLRKIADDPDYVFGPFDEKRKNASCSDVILKQLTKIELVSNKEIPWIITPDYLFWTTQNNKTSLEIVGYNINSK
ncbi:MAG: hypothetical protein WAX44_01960 [Minisyncoccia bacterium]